MQKNRRMFRMIEWHFVGLTSSLEMSVVGSMLLSSKSIVCQSCCRIFWWLQIYTYPWIGFTINESFAFLCQRSYWRFIYRSEVCYSFKDHGVCRSWKTSLTFMTVMWMYLTYSWDMWNLWTRKHISPPF